MDANPDRFLPIFIHLNDCCDIPWGLPRFSSFYGLTYIPHNQYDGLFESNSLEADFVARKEVKTYVTIDLEARLNVTDWDVTATVCVEPAGSEMSMRIYMLQMLDNYPTVAWYYRNCLQIMADTEDVVVPAGECVEVTRTFELGTPSAANPADVKFAAWAQDPLSSGPAEIHQAAQLAGFFEVPFHGAGMETGDFTEWATTSQ